jgi:hypothetical protein
MNDCRPLHRLLLRASAFVRWALRLLLLAWWPCLLRCGALCICSLCRESASSPAAGGRRLACAGGECAHRGHHAPIPPRGMLPAFELLRRECCSTRRGARRCACRAWLLSLSPRSLLACSSTSCMWIVRRSTCAAPPMASCMSRGWIRHGARHRRRPAGPIWFLNQPEFVIRHGAVVWTDELRGEAPLALREVDLVLRNQARRHELRLDATPPPEWGDRFGLVGGWSSRSCRWATAAGVSGPASSMPVFSRVDVSRLQRHADLGVDLQARAGVRCAPGSMCAALTSPAATADLAWLAGVCETRLVRRCSRCSWRHLSGGWPAGSAGDTASSSRTQDLAVSTPPRGSAGPVAMSQLSWTAANASRPAHGELTADRLDLAALGQVASRLAAGHGGARGAAAAYDPKRAGPDACRRAGQGPPNAIAEVQRPGGASPQRCKWQARAEGAAAQAAPPGHAPVGTPGLRGATARLRSHP